MRASPRRPASNLLHRRRRLADAVFAAEHLASDDATDVIVRAP